MTDCDLKPLYSRRALWWIAPTSTAAVVAVVCTAVALSGVVVTAGGDDQEGFHLPSVMLLRVTAPGVDLVGMPTATGPLYHLVVAALSGLFRLGAPETQAVGALFGVALAALAVYHAQASPNWFGRALTVAPLLLSAYFWESALWMLTDDAAMLFTFGALAVALRFDGLRAQVGVGLLIAAAIATRQNSVWLLVPACAAYLYVGGKRPVWPGSAVLVRICIPGVVVLVALVALWGGLTPPTARASNATHSSPASLSYVAAVAAVFFIPILIATVKVDEMRRWARLAAVVGFSVAIPAIVFPSAATGSSDGSRRGGPVWSVVQVLPDLGGRSPMLMALAFAGGFSATVVVAIVPPRYGAVLAGSLLALAGALFFGAQLFQKYAELPIAVLAVLVLTRMFASNRVVRQWPLIALATLQSAVTAGIVVLPILQSR